jgi:hypothetical protein
MVLFVAACSSSVGGSGNAASSGAGSSSAPSSPGAASASASPSSSSQSGFPTDPQSLAAFLVKGNTSIKTAHLSLVETVGAQRIAGAGDEQLSDGQVQAVDLTERVGSIRLRFIIIGDTLYAKVPRSVFASSKPWVEISSTTTDARLKSLYDSFENSIQSGTGKTVQTFVGAAKDVRLVGVEHFDGVPVGHYKITIDVASLPADYPNRDALQQSGLTSIPAEVYVDTQGRTRKVTENLTVGSQHVASVITLTRIDQPVHITPPPANQVQHA